MSVLTATAPCIAYRAVAATGELVPEAVLVARVGWLIDLVSGIGAKVLADHWSGPDLELLASGLGPDGRGLPRKAYMAMRRLGWGASTFEGVSASDRLLRCAEEEAGRHFVKLAG